MVWSSGLRGGTRRRRARELDASSSRAGRCRRRGLWRRTSWTTRRGDAVRGEKEAQLCRVPDVGVVQQRKPGPIPLVGAGRVPEVATVELRGVNVVKRISSGTADAPLVLLVAPYDVTDERPVGQTLQTASAVAVLIEAGAVLRRQPLHDLGAKSVQSFLVLRLESPAA